jgi:ribosomal protein S18 acetylase RimI-like enzyme
MMVRTSNRARVRGLARRDYAAVKEIEGIIVNEYREYLKETKEEDAIELWITPDYFNHYLQTRASYVAEVGRKVVGFILSQPTSYVHGAKKEFWLEYIAVLPESRKNGIGAELMSNVINYAKRQGIRLLYTTLNPNNDESIRFLVKHNFEVKDWKQATRRIA